MVDEETARKGRGGRRGMAQTSAALVVAGALVAARLVAAGGAAGAPAPPSGADGGAAGARESTPGGSPGGKAPPTDGSLTLTYTNPINLPSMEVDGNPTTMPPTEEGVANVSARMLQILAKPEWTAADGRTLSGLSKSGFVGPGENFSGIGENA